MSTLFSRVVSLLTFGRVNTYEPGERASLGITGLVDDTVPFLEPYGLTVRPHPGAQVVLASPGGNTDQQFALLVTDADRRPQPALDGQVVLWSQTGGELATVTLDGDALVIKRGGSVITLTDSEIVADWPKGRVTMGHGIAISAATGDVVIDTKGDISILAGNNLMATVGANASVSAQGIVTLAGNGIASSLAVPAVGWLGGQPAASASVFITL